jgi:hypothetical protein
VSLPDKPGTDGGAEITLTVPFEVNPGPVLSGSGTGPTVPLYRMPVVAVTNGKTIVCDNQRLPFPTGFVRHAECFDLFEYVIDDQRLLAEVARILTPGAPIWIAVPNRRGLGKIDRLNAYRYLRDTTGRGSPMPSLAEVGWRRHYTPVELTAMLMEAGFREIVIRTVGAWIGDASSFGVSLSRETVEGRSEDAVKRIRGKSQAISRSIRIPTNLGARIVASAVRSY